MNTIEEKARRRAFDITSSLGLNIAELIVAIHDLYIEAATEALAGQWRKYPDEDFPEHGNEYVVLTDSGDLCAVNKYAEKEEVKQYTNIVAWMPIPEIPKAVSHEC